MSRTFQCVVLIVAAVVLAGCEDEKSFVSQPISERIDNVSGVYMHHINQYSIAYSDSSTSSEVKIRSLPGGDWHPGLCSCCVHRPEFRFYRDVPTGKDIWVLIRGKATLSSFWDSSEVAKRASIIEIHIHATKEVSGGGWSRGKFGSGQTNVIDSE